MRNKKIKTKAFFSKRFMGLGIDLDFSPAIADRDIILTFQLTILYFRTWVVMYRN